MKTVKEWLFDLNEPYKSQSFLNAPPNTLNTPVASMSEALRMAFWWACTEQGYEYWSKLHSKYQENENS